MQSFVVVLFPFSLEKKKKEGNGQDKKNTKRCKFQDNTGGPLIQTPPVWRIWNLRT